MGAPAARQFQRFHREEDVLIVPHGYSTVHGRGVHRHALHDPPPPREPLRRPPVFHLPSPEDGWLHENFREEAHQVDSRVRPTVPKSTVSEDNWNLITFICRCFQYVYDIKPRFSKFKNSGM